MPLHGSVCSRFQYFELPGEVCLKMVHVEHQRMVIIKLSSQYVFDQVLGQYIGGGLLRDEPRVIREYI
jgi:hypothetical protein